MKYLLLLEGKTEQSFIELLIDKGLFSINEDDMIDLRPHQKRHVESYLVTMIRQLDPDDKVRILRIGDKMTDKLKIPLDIRQKIESEIKYCTKPEFEILIIIAEGLFQEYQKVKSRYKPKVFANQTIKMNGVRYNKNHDWVKSYFYDKDIKQILSDYKRMADHKEDENFVLDLIVL